MINFNGGTVSVGVSLSPLSLYAGYMLLHSGQLWIAICFLALSIAQFALVLAMLMRYMINVRRAQAIAHSFRLAAALAVRK